MKAGLVLSVLGTVPPPYQAPDLRGTASLATSHELPSPIPGNLPALLVGEV